MINKNHLGKAISHFLEIVKKELSMATKRTETQKSVSSLGVRRGVSAKRYIPETTPSLKTSPSARKTEKLDVNSPLIQQRIVEKAYELYVNRGYTHGNDLQDWLDAEQIVLQELSKE